METIRDKAINRVTGFFLRRAHLVICVSDFVKNLAISQAGLRHGDIPNVCVVYNGSDFPSHPFPMTLGRDLNVCIAGELSKRKGIDDLIWILRRFKNKENLLGIRFHVYGWGPFGELLKTMELDGFPIFLHGATSDTNEIFFGKQLHLILSKEEGFGRVVTEAMARGIPTVCYSRGAFPEILTNDHDGFLCSSRFEIAAKLIYIKMHPEILLASAKHARQTFLNRFSSERFLHETISSINSALPGIFLPVHRSI